MPLFVFHCRDGENSAALRKVHRSAHLEHVEAHLDRYAVAGPLTRGDATVGSLLIIKADDEAVARSFFETDPYFTAGVWQSIRVDEFRGVAGDWVGGAAWKR